MSNTESYVGNQEVTLDKFECFVDLPVELRQGIWRLASYLPRNVCINVDKAFEADSIELPIAFSSNSPVPAVLHICKESRSEGLKHYSLEFGTCYEGRAYDGPRRSYTITIPPIVYFNWDADTLYTNRLESIGEWDDNEGKWLGKTLKGKGLRSIALNICDEFQTDYTLKVIPKDGTLEEIILFSCDEALLEGLDYFEFIDIEHPKQQSRWQSILDRVESWYSYDGVSRPMWESILDGNIEAALEWYDLVDDTGEPTTATKFLPQVRICDVVPVEAI